MQGMTGTFDELGADVCIVRVTGLRVPLVFLFGFACLPVAAMSVLRAQRGGAQRGCFWIFLFA